MLFKSMAQLLLRKIQHAAGSHRSAQDTAGARGVITQRLVARLNGDRHRIGDLIADNSSPEQCVQRNAVSLRQRKQQRKDR